MHLAILVVDPIIISVLWIKEKLKKTAPPIDNLDEYIKHLSSLHNKKQNKSISKIERSVINNARLNITWNWCCLWCCWCGL